ALSGSPGAPHCTGGGLGSSHTWRRGRLSGSPCPCVWSGNGKGDEPTALDGRRCRSTSAPPSSLLATFPSLVLRVRPAPARATLRCPSRRISWPGAHSWARTPSADMRAPGTEFSRCRVHGCAALVLQERQDKDPHNVRDAQ